MPLDCSFDCEYIDELAASIEALSEHSIGHAISRAAPHSYEVEGSGLFPAWELWEMREEGDIYRQQETHGRQPDSGRSC